MVSNPRLYTYAGNKDGLKAMITAEYAGVMLDIPPFRMGVDNTSKDFFEMSPRGALPVLETATQPPAFISEPNAIARYIARLGSCLYGETCVQEAQVESWIDVTTAKLDAPLMSALLPLLGVGDRCEAKEKKAMEAVASAMRTLDAHLETHTFLVGESITLADVVAVCNMHLGFKLLFDGAYRKEFRNVTRYFRTCVQQPFFKKVLGDKYAMCTTKLGSA